MLHVSCQPVLDLTVSGIIKLKGDPDLCEEHSEESIWTKKDAWKVLIQS